jgi:hypothetical protein
MRVAFNGPGVGQNTLLSPPGLPQAQGGILDLGSPDITAEGAIKVEIPAYAQLGWGDRVTVVFRDEYDRSIVRLAYLPNPAQFKDEAYVAEVRVRPLSALASGSYHVGYSVTSRTGNISNSEAIPVTVTHSPYAGGGPVTTVGTAFFGTYVRGVIGSWVVPADYSLSTNSDIVVRSLNGFAPPGTTTTDVRLKIQRIPPDGGTESIAVVQTSDGNEWTVSAVGNTNVDLHKEDLISIELDGLSNARFFVALAL